jgi:N-acetylglucosaminyldiphosphoundecaprenol N-acetyl-beta-D-mannosaminyltransferase
VKVLVGQFLLKDIPMIYGSQNDIYSFIEDQIGKEKLWIVTLNALMYMEYLKGNDYSRAISKASFSIPDGVGIVKLLKKKGIETERCPGIDTMKYLLELSQISNYRIFLLGSEEDVVKRAAQTIEKMFNVNIVGFHHGYFDINAEGEVVQKINDSKTDLLFVGMGIPKQESFIFRNYETLEAKLMMGVGGSFDVFAGITKRAPLFFQKLGLEWLYRMFEEPHRFKKLPDLFKFYMNLYRNKD